MGKKRGTEMINNQRSNRSNSPFFTHQPKFSIFNSQFSKVLCYTFSSMPKVLLIFLEKSPRLTEGQLKVMADIGVAAGQLTLGAMVLPFVIAGLDKTKLPLVVSGAVGTALFWIGSVFLAKRLNHES